MSFRRLVRQHWWHEWPARGLSANEIARALISMMARSTTCSNQRPDTLMRDRICRTEETSCNARPDHTFVPGGDIQPLSPRLRTEVTLWAELSIGTVPKVL